MSEEVTRLRPWQIKDYPEAKREAVIRAAAGAGKTVAQWLEPVIDAGLGNGSSLPMAVNQRTSGLSVAELIAIASNPALAQWLRSGAARRLGDLIGAVPPTPPPRRKALPAPDQTV